MLEKVKELGALIVPHEGKQFAVFSFDSDAFDDISIIHPKALIIAGQMAELGFIDLIKGFPDNSEDTTSIHFLL